MKTEKELAIRAIKDHGSVSYMTRAEQGAFEYMIKRMYRKGVSANYMKKFVDHIIDTK